MSPNEPRTSAFAETLPTALPYLPPRSQPVDKPVPCDVDPITLEPAGVASHPPGSAETGRRLSVSRITIALFTLGLSIPFVGIRRTDATRSDR